MNRHAILAARTTFVFTLILALSACQDIYRLQQNDFLIHELYPQMQSDGNIEIVAEAYPYYLKLLDTAVENDPENEELLIAAGKNYAIYADYFVLSPAKTMEAAEWSLHTQEFSRAKALFLKAQDYLSRALELKQPDFSQKLNDSAKLAELRAEQNADSLPALAWFCFTGFKAFESDSFDPELMISLYGIFPMAERVFELDPLCQDGFLRDQLAFMYGSFPSSMGGSEEKARSHFNTALEQSIAGIASYVAIASSVSINIQDREEFVELLEDALKIDLESAPEIRTRNSVYRRYAAWLLDHQDDYFL